MFNRHNVPSKVVLTSLNYSCEVTTEKDVNLTDLGSLALELIKLLKESDGLENQCTNKEI